MTHENTEHLDFGTGQKKLGVYSVGMAVCVLLTIAAFYTVMSGQYSRIQSIAIIFTAAVVQFLVQVIFFLRLNLKSDQGVVNVFALIYTIIILGLIVTGSLWIMANTNYYMMH